MSSRGTLRKSLENSSIKALPKIVKASGRFQRYLWTMALVIGVTVVGYQLSNLLQQYFQFSTTINIVSIQGTPPFPDVTLCHMDTNWTNNVLEPNLKGENSQQNFYHELDQIQREYK
ncbi:hypothetical protein CAPTEDRAFT_199552, partial [Capitella teleta]